MKRVVIFKNGTNTDGKVVMITHSLSDLLLTASQKLAVNALHIYTAQGGLIDDINLIRDDDILYISAGEPFVRPFPHHLTKGIMPVTPALSYPHDHWIRLNVGGRIYSTTLSTLISKEPSSMLAKMFGTDGGTLCPSVKDPSGAYMIDRSFVYFEPLLNYLRTGKLIIDPGINPEGVLEEAIFYGLDSVICELEQQLLDDGNKASYSGNKPLCRMEVISALITTKPKQELRFQAVNLKESNLTKMDLRNINFKYADFSDANLSGANLSGCCLERANLSRANLESAQMINVKLLCANLENACLRSCNFEDPAGGRANCEGVNMKGATLEGSMMAGVNLRVATLKNANLKNCDLRGSCLAGADLENCDLSGSDLHEANLRGANLKDAAFELMQTPLHMSQTCDL